MEGLSETFIGINDALVRSGYLSRDREMATELRKGMERFLALSKVAQRETDDDVEEMGEQDAQRPLASSKGSASEGCSEIRRISRQSTVVQRPGQGEQTTSRNGSFSPRLSYSVWSGSPTDPSSPPRAMNNVIHYITAGHDSFAARLYWKSLTLGFRSLRGDDGFPIDFAISMFRYKMRYSTPQRVLTVIGHVLNQMLLGTNDITFEPSQNWDAFESRKPLPDPTDSGAVDTNAVKNAIHRDIIQDGGLVDDYLDTWGVERYLASRWGALVDSSTVRPLQSNLVMDVEPLVKRLATAAVTIGEGPRYSTLEVDMAVQAFHAETHSTAGAAGGLYP